MKVLVTAGMPAEVTALIERDHQVGGYHEDIPLDRQRLRQSIIDQE